MNQDFSDEIDLRQVARTIRDFFRSNSRLLLLSTVVGGAIGVAGFFLIPPRYESQLILNSDILKEHFSKRLEDNLSRLINEKNYSVLGERLSLTGDEAKTIRAVKIESVGQTMINGQEGDVRMTITARVTNVEILPKLQAGLLNYLRNIDFVKVRVRQREVLYQTLIEQLDKEIRSLDSLKVSLLGRKSGGTTAAGLVLVDPTNIYAQLIELHKRQLDYRNALELHESIQVMEGFTPFLDPVFPKFYMMLLLGFALGLTAGLTISIGRILLSTSPS
ncbi:MAG: hypothetical protein JNN04_02465 [Cyclobacteriaceae bacterium]|nr:hypothetical protein [Cyclobacteriaceae bacterium]